MASETRESIAIRNAKSDAVGLALANGTLRIYHEAIVPPEFGGNPGQLLVSISLPAVFSPASAGAITEDLLETTITGTGEANWYRAYSNQNAFLLDGPCYLASDPTPPVGGIALTITTLLENLTITGTFTYTSPQQD